MPENFGLSDFLVSLFKTYFVDHASLLGRADPRTLGPRILGPWVALILFATQHSPDR